jgi:hypothetical protein
MTLSALIDVVCILPCIISGSTYGNKGAFAAAVAKAAPDQAARIEKEKNWRFGYPK